jgi:hypothetical protein
MSTTTENKNTDVSSTKKKVVTGVTKLSAGHKRLEFNLFATLHQLVEENHLSSDVFNEKMDEIHFNGSIVEKTAYWKIYESKDEATSRNNAMKLFINKKKAVADALAKVAKTEANAIAKAEAKALAPKKEKKSKKDDATMAVKSESESETEKVEEIAAAVPVPEPIKVEVASPEKVEDAPANDSKKKKKAKKNKEESSTEA